MADNCQMLMLVVSYPKILGAVKLLQLRVKGMNTYAMYCIILCNTNVFCFFYTFTKLGQFCFCFVGIVYGV